MRRRFRRRDGTPSRIRTVKLPSVETRREMLARSRAARRQLFFLLPAAAGLIVVNRYRREIFDLDEPIRYATATILVLIGWALARSAARVLAPRLLRSRLDPQTAGVVGFTVRLLTFALLVLVALRLAGINPATIALGASFTAIIIGLAAQQTFGNVLAGIVLLTSRPFQIGDRVRFAGFGMDVEGTIESHGLLYVTMSDGDDSVLVPNTTALTMSIRPRREPADVNVLVDLPSHVDPVELEDRIRAAVNAPVREDPHIGMERIAGDTVTMRIQATPVNREQGGQLAREILEAVRALSAELDTREHAAVS